MNLQTPDILLMLSKDVLVFDNLYGRIFLVTLADLNNGQAYQKAQLKLDEIENKLRTNLPRGGLSNPADAKVEQDYRVHFSQN